MWFLILCSDSDTFNYRVFLYQRHHPENVQITDRNMPVKI